MEERSPKDYDEIIKGMAFKFSQSLKEPVEDLIQEGYLIFWELAKREMNNDLPCKFEAALSNTIRHFFINIYHKQRRLKRRAFLEIHNISEEELWAHDPSESLIRFIDMSEEMKEVTHIIIDSPKELLELLGGYDFKLAFNHYLRRYKGWGNKKLRKFWNEIDLKSVE